MLLKDLFEKRLKVQFSNAKIKGTSELAPRVGYYFIHQVNYREIPFRGKVPIATVHWKKSLEDDFTVEVQFEIALSSLGLDHPLSYMNLAKKVIHISSVYFENNEFRLNNKPRIKSEYTVITDLPNFKSLQYQGWRLLAGTAKTLFEAHLSIEKNSTIDMLPWIELEAGSDDAYDSPMDGDLPQA